MNSMSRRDVLKLAGRLVTAAAILPPGSLSTELGAGQSAGLIAPELIDRAVDANPPPTPLGRVAEFSVAIRAEATAKSKLVRIARRDDVLKLIGQVTGQAVMPYNNQWFQTDEGYVYSSGVQPVQNILNDPLPDQAAGHFWGEISVPFTDSRLTPDPNGRRSMRLEYSTVYRVIKAVQDKSGTWWYRLQEGVTNGPGPYILAAHIRRIDPSELTPLSPDVADKKVEVNLRQQRITAYENGNPVLTHLISSGVGGFATPRGMHKVLYKTPTSRMIGGSGSNYYDLPGVPFPTFITWTGVAIHGTYWHNDYGRPRSHGCINAPAEVAKWFWRWTLPAAPYDPRVFYTRKNAATNVHVV